jgi:hypothetical protein
MPGIGVQARGKRRGRAQLNPGQPGLGSYAFINFLKGGSFYIPTRFAYPGHLNASGYPQTAPATTGHDIVYTVDIPADYPGNWVLRWTGSFGSAGYGVAISGTFGTYSYESPNSFVTVADPSYGIRMKGTDGYVEFTPPTDTTSLSLTFYGGKDFSGVTDVALYRKDQETLYERGEIFNPDYVEHIRDLNPRELRFLGWDDVNNSMCAAYAHLRPESYSHYQGLYWISSIWGGTASVTSGAYTVALADFVLADKAAVQFFVPSGTDINVANPTLSVNGTTAKPLADQYWSVFSTSGQSGNYEYITAGQVATAIYDAKLDRWAYIDSGFNGPSVPISVQAAFCNKVRKDGWFLAPHVFNSASFESWGREIRNKLSPTLNAYVVLSNENLLPSATLQKSYMEKYAEAAGWPFPTYDNGFQTWSLKSRELFVATKTVWAESGVWSTLKNTGEFLIFNSLGYNLNFFYKGVALTLDSSGNFTTGSGGTCSGSVANGVLTVTGTPSFVVRAGMAVSGPGVTGTVRVRYYTGSGATGGAGTYQLDSSTSTNSGTYTLSSAGSGNAVAADYTRAVADGGDGRPYEFMDCSSSAVYWRGPLMCNPFTPNDGPTGSITSGTLQTAQSITGITNAATGVVQKNSHGYNNGDRLYLTCSGMSTLNGSWTTVANKTTNDFELSNTVNSSGAAMSSDTTSAGTFASGTMARVIPGLYDELITAADDYDSGNSAQIASALAWMSDHQRQGTKLLADGVTEQLGGATTLGQYQGGDGLMYWTQIRDNIVDPLGLPFIAYEGGFEGGIFGFPFWSRLGYDLETTQKVNALNYGWRKSDYARDELIYFYELFASVTGFLSPSYSIDVGVFAANILAGSITGTTLTVTSNTVQGTATVYPGYTITAREIEPGTTIVRQLSSTEGDGSWGGEGTYEVSKSQTTGAVAKIRLWAPLIWSLSLAPGTSGYEPNTGSDDLGTHEGFKRFSTNY